ncbi:MAG: hypothetical protein QOH63_2327 [Acidobacteriota bacterium]|jgi:predicted CopG family antitoxin|nr:hypothetical protein [Acidobacteriota bacterium]
MLSKHIAYNTEPGCRSVYMSRTLTISDDLYARLEAEANARGLNSVERLLEEWRRTEADLNQRQAVVLKIDGLRGRLFAKYGEMPDSVELVREDRARF